MTTLTDEELGTTSSATTYADTDQVYRGTFEGRLVGTATSAKQLETPFKLELQGDVAGNVDISGKQGVILQTKVSHATEADRADFAGNTALAANANYADLANLANFAVESGKAEEAEYSKESNHAKESDHSLTTDRADIADKALLSDRATIADRAYKADSAIKDNKGNVIDETYAVDKDLIHKDEYLTNAIIQGLATGTGTIDETTLTITIDKIASGGLTIFEFAPFPTTEADRDTTKIYVSQANKQFYIFNTETSKWENLFNTFNTAISDLATKHNTDVQSLLNKIQSTKTELQNTINSNKTSTDKTISGIETNLKYLIQNNKDYAEERYVKKTGDTLSGILTSTNKWLLRRQVNTEGALITGGTEWTKSANLQLYGGENADTSGTFILMANNGTNRCDLNGTPTGELIWGGLNVLTSKGGNVGYLTYTSMGAMQRDVNNSLLVMAGGTIWNKSAFVKLTGGDYEAESEAGAFYVGANDGTNRCDLNGTPTGELIWGGKHIVRSVNGIKADREGNVSLISSVPIGAILFYAGADTPSGYLLCAGGAVSRTTYANLFAKIGTKYGAGDGSTTFNLPDLIDRFVQGGATAGTYKNAGLPNIEGHTDSNFDSERDLSVNPFWSSNGAIYVTNTMTHGHSAHGISSTSGVGFKTLAFNASRSNSIYGSSTTVQPPALTLRPIIKY